MFTVVTYLDTTTRKVVCNGQLNIRYIVYEFYERPSIKLATHNFYEIFYNIYTV